jgi:hypothetical protein
MSESSDLVQRAQALLERVEFLDYAFDVRHGHGGVFLQASYTDPDTYTGEPSVQHTRKWLLSPRMTASEIVQTAFKLCLTSMEHRTREAFKFKGARIFGPHFDVEDLVVICRGGLENAGARKETAR